jgi:anti-sigma factor RsiW
MNMTQEMLEIMIGKYLDGEITPGEQRLLEAELDRDPQAKELLGQLQDLHESCGEVVASEILGQGKAPEDVFEQAWGRRSKQPLRLMMKIRGHARFAAGVAAGLVMGLALHFVLPIVSTSGSDPVGPNVVARDTESEAIFEQPALPGFLSDPAGEMILNVDWYNFTDKQGNKWLVEGLREDMVKPAVYYDGL